MSNRIARKEAIPLLEAFKQMFAESGARNSHNTQRIFMAWNEVSGAAQYTIKRFFRDGKLYITLSSSVVCSQLSMQKIRKRPTLLILLTSLSLRFSRFLTGLSGRVNDTVCSKRPGLRITI